MITQLKHALIWTLILQTILLPTGLQTQSAHAQTPLPKFNQTPHPITQEVLKVTSDPVMDYIMSVDRPLPHAEFHFDDSDPVMDQDPFFIRSQRWVKPGTQVAGRTTIKLDEAGTLPVLEIQQPLHEILRTDDFIFLAPNDDRYFDSKVLSSEDSQSKGVFILHRETWQRAALNKVATPVFFLPLHDGNWGSSARAFEMKEHDAVYFTDNQSPGVPIPLHDLEIVVKAESLNHYMASTMSRDFIPPRGSTAGYGVIFTGRNLDRPEQKSFSLEKFLSRFSLIPNAQAEGIFTGKLLERIVRVGVITGVSAVLSVVLRCTVYRDFFARKEEKEKLEGGKSSWIGRNTRYFLTVQAHSFLTLSQVASSTFGNIVEYSADRYFSQSAAGEQTVVRKFLKSTVLRTRDNAQRVPVNDWTLLMGTGVVGTIDTAFVAYQTYVVSPAMISWLGEEIPFLKERADTAVDKDNPNLGMIRRNDVIKNAIAYITIGASSYSSDIQRILRQELIPKIEEEMQKEGLDPTLPKNQSIKAARLTVILETVMKEKGLPGSDEFLFDYSVLYETALSVLGFKSEGTKNLIGVSRPGLTLSTLDLAIKRASLALKKSPQDTQLIAALSTLKETKDQISFVRQWAGIPFAKAFKSTSLKEEFSKASQAVRAAKQSLLSLTYEGDRSLDASFIPEPWVKMIGLDGARLASQFYRESFYDLFTGRHSGKEIDDVSAKIAEEARINALEELKARLGMRSLDELPKEVLKFHQTELELIETTERLRLAQIARDQATPYAPPQLGFIERYQQRRAVRKADEAYLTQYKESFKAWGASSDQMSRWQKLYVKYYAEQVGLYPERLDSVRAAEETEKFSKDPKVKEYLDQLSHRDQLITLSTYRATQEIEQYLADTVGNSKADPLSPDQPGITQRLRQKSLLKKPHFLSKIATRALRAIDSLTSQSEYRTGFGAWVYRNVPAAFDVLKGMSLDLSALPTAMTAGYLWTRYLWNVDYPMSMWLLGILLHFTVTGPSRTLNRFFQNQGIKPMGSVGSVVLFAGIYSWVTFFGFIPNQLFAADFQNLWDSVGNYVKNICSRKLTGE